MSRYKPSDLARFGAGARRQIDAFKFADQARAELLREQAPAASKTRHKGKRVEIDGITFGSGAEARYYLELKHRRNMGEISGLEVHPKFLLTVAGVVVATYIADFRWTEAGSTRVVDVKGKGAPLEPIFKLKRRIFEALYPFKLEIVEL